MRAGIVFAYILASNASAQLTLTLVPVVLGLLGIPAVGQFDGSFRSITK